MNRPQFQAGIYQIGEQLWGLHRFGERLTNSPNPTPRLDSGTRIYAEPIVIGEYVKAVIDGGLAGWYYAVSDLNKPQEAYYVIEERLAGANPTVPSSSFPG